MRIALAKDASKCPKTRRELLSHVWAHTDLRDTDVFKEGPFYAARKGRVTAATHCRTLDSYTFAEWVKFLRDIPERKT